MADLRVRYMGLELANPLVVSSSSMANTVEKIEKAAAAGAGAIVLKSLFEEEIQAAIDSDMIGVDNTEAIDYVRAMETDAGLSKYRALIKDAKAAVDVPIIASINGVTPEWWIEHVPALEKAGADALELNISMMLRDYHDCGEKVCQFYTDTVSAVAERVSIPISVKIGHYFSSIPALVDRLKWSGASAVVLFNRFYQIDIDINAMRLKSASPLSTTADLAFPLRWISKLSGHTDIEFAASSGVHSGEDVVKVLLAGAQVSQVCSALFKHGVGHLSSMRDGLAAWMDDNSFATVDQFRGKLSQKRSDAPESYERLQYIKALVGHE